MSIAAMNIVWGMNLEPTRKLILLKLADNYNDHTGQCNPSIARLARECCVCRRTVERHLSAMRDMGIISWEAKVSSSGQSSNVYTLRHIDAPPMSPVSHTPPTPMSHPLTFLNKNHIGGELFDEFWAAYPKKVDKKKSRAKFLKFSEEIQRQIISNVKARARADKQWLGGYIPNPMTYLNGERWEDEWDRAEGSGSMVEGFDYV